MKIWDAETGKEIRTLRGHPRSPCGAVAYKRGRHDASSAAAEGCDSVKLWDAATGVELLTLQGHAVLQRTVAFGPDGNRIVGAGEGRHGEGVRRLEPARG